MEIRAKERLTGAVILVALVVLLVPELLSGPRRSAVRPAAAAGEPPMRSYTVQLNDEPASPVGPQAGAPAQPEAATQSEVAAQTESAPPPSATAQAQAVTPSGAAAQTASVPPAGQRPATGQVPAASAATTRPTGAPPAKTPPSGSARTPGSAPTSAKHQHEHSAGPASGRHAAKVASGPHAAHAAKMASGPHGAKAVSGPHAATVPSGSHAAGAASLRAGWLVQVGSFASREHADRLAHQLKLKGFGAFVSQSTSHGRKWYRVRVGPERDRTAAVAVARRLHAAGQAAVLQRP